MRRNAAVALAFAAALASSPTGAQDWIAMEVSGGVLTFPVSVEGKATRAALNSSATNSSIDAGLAAGLGLALSGKRQRVQSAYSSNRIVPSEALLHVAASGASAALKNVPALEQPGLPVQLGADFLEQFVLQIDYPNQRLRFAERAALDLRKQSNVKLRAAEGSCGRARRSDLSNDLGVGPGDFLRQVPGASPTAQETPCLPTVQVQFPDAKKVWLLLDTAASGPIVVSRSIAEREGWIERFRRGEAQSHDVFGQTTSLDLLVLPSLRLGPYELGGVPVATPAEGERLLTGSESWDRVSTGSHVTRGARANGRLGYDALRHFVVTIDLGRALMRIERPARAEGGAVGASSS